MDASEAFPLQYRSFSTADGPDDTGLFIFSGSASKHPWIRNPDGTQFAFNFQTANGPNGSIGKATPIDESDIFTQFLILQKAMRGRQNHSIQSAVIIIYFIVILRTVLTAP